MFVTRRAEFSASHVCRVREWDDARNQETFGEEAHPNGHGHNYVVEATIQGEPHAQTGMVIDLKDVKTILEEEVVEPMDHRFLNYEVPPFDRVVPTTANVAREIFRRLDARFGQHTLASLYRIRLFETPDLFVDVVRSSEFLTDGDLL